MSRSRTCCGVIGGPGISRSREELKRCATFPLWHLRGHATAYDAAYIALAEALGATLLTRDGALAKVPGVRAVVEVI